MLSVAKALWPVKTAQNLAQKTSVSERAAEFWLAGKYDMSLAAARDLIRSEDGYAFLVALIGEDCDARWWKRVKLHAAQVESGRAIRAELKKQEQIRLAKQQLQLLEDSD